MVERHRGGRAMSWAGWWRGGPLILAAALLAWGIWLRRPLARYPGPADPFAYYDYIYRSLGAYSDIAGIWFWAQLWRHPVPYFGYTIEYPVGTGALIWLLGFAGADVWTYFLATALVLAACGLAVVALLGRLAGADPWLLALSPALALYGCLNWDLAGILPTVAALLLFQRGRDGWGAFALTGAIWTKFFPIAILPLVVAERCARGRWRDAGRIVAVSGAGSLLINAPVALEAAPGGVRLRDSWAYFFRYNQGRAREVNLWNLLEQFGLRWDTARLNTASGALLAFGVVALAALLARAVRARTIDPGAALPLAALACLGWWFFVNKVYSPQYGLWLAALLAAVAAPRPLVVAFAAVDLGYFAASFVTVYLGQAQNTALDVVYWQVLFPSMILREGTILAIVGWAAWRLVGAPAQAPDPIRERP